MNARDIGAQLLVLAVLIPGCQAAPAEAYASDCQRFVDLVQLISAMPEAERATLAMTLREVAGADKRLILRALNFVSASPGATDLHLRAAQACQPERPA
jgi:hypothetical protein